MSLGLLFVYNGSSDLSLAKVKRLQRLVCCSDTVVQVEVLREIFLFGKRIYYIFHVKLLCCWSWAYHCTCVILETTVPFPPWHVEVLSVNVQIWITACNSFTLTFLIAMMLYNISALYMYCICIQQARHGLPACLLVE